MTAALLGRERRSSAVQAAQESVAIQSMDGGRSAAVQAAQECDDGIHQRRDKPLRASQEMER